MASEKIEEVKKEIKRAKAFLSFTPLFKNETREYWSQKIKAEEAKLNLLNEKKGGA